MPRYTHISKPPYKKRPVGWKRRGGSFKSFLLGANKFLKKSGLLSTLGQIGSQMAPDKYGALAGVLGNAAGAMGYGRRRHRHCGGSLRLAGGKMSGEEANKKLRQFDQQFRKSANKIGSRRIIW